MRARDYLLSHFVDEEQGGVFWSVTPQGEPLDTKKQFYAIAFAIYGLAEHFRATVNRRDDMAGFWKCPYHNSRMHIEAITLLQP